MILIMNVFMHFIIIIMRFNASMAYIKYWNWSYFDFVLFKRAVKYINQPDLVLDKRMHLWEGGSKCIYISFAFGYRINTRLHLGSHATLVVYWSIIYCIFLPSEICAFTLKLQSVLHVESSQVVVRWPV